MASLVLVRHGLTDWNREGRWQGFTDTSISKEGQEEVKKAAQLIRDIRIDLVYTSNLSRTKETYRQIADVLGLNCPVLPKAALNERDYGIYTGKNKWEVEKELGKEKFEKLRRDFDYPVPAGETLKNVYERVVPFYRTLVLNNLKIGKNVMIVSSGNTIRALLKYLENISDEDIAGIELTFSEVIIFEINEKGEIISKKIKK